VSQNHGVHVLPYCEQAGEGEDVMPPMVSAANTMVGTLIMLLIGKTSHLQNLAYTEQYYISCWKRISSIFDTLNIWWPMPRFLIFISQIGIETSTFLYSNFCLRVAWWCRREVVWRLDCLGAALTWLWLGLKSTEELSLSPQWRSTVRTLANRPMGRFAWTNHVYFKITRPGSSTVTPLYQ
jgi:hypothetical protein